MRLLVEKITDISRAYALKLSAGELNEQLGGALAIESVQFIDEALIDYRVSREGGALLIEGECRAELLMQCSRCLTQISQPVQESFSMVLQLQYGEDQVCEELELNEEQINSITPIDGEIELLPILQEQLFVSLPAQPLCREACSGLCPYCGVDQNKKSCQCEPVPFNNRFGKLKDIKVDRS